MKEVLSDLLQRSNVLRTPRLFFLTWWRLGTPSYPLVIFIPLGAAFIVKALSSLLFPHPNAHLQQEEWFIWIAICGKGIGISNFPLSLFESQVTCRELIPILWTVNHTGVGSPKMWESAGQDGGVRLCNSAHILQCQLSSYKGDVLASRWLTPLSYFITDAEQAGKRTTTYWTPLDIPQQSWWW